NLAYFRDGILTYVQATDAYVWTYGGYGYASPKPEDASHASVNEQWLRFGLDQGQLDTTQALRVEHTLLDVLYADGNPGCLADFVDGSKSSSSPCEYTPPAAIGISTWGDAVAASAGGRVELWELARNVLLATHLEGGDVPLTMPKLGAYDATILANLFVHRPSELAPDSRWVTVAGSAKDAAPPTSDAGGIRFYV